MNSNNDMPSTGDVEIPERRTLDYWADIEYSRGDVAGIYNRVVEAAKTHITRLQSELTKVKEDLRLEKIVSRAMSTQANDWAALAAQRKASLTTALELLGKASDEIKATWKIEWPSIPDDSHAHAIDAFLAQQSAPVCEHEWVDVRNEYVKSGEICAKLCGAIRPGNQSTPTTKDGE